MKITFVILMLSIFVFTSQAQKTYSIQNLEQTSPKDLNILLEEAKKNKTTALVLTIAGSVSIVSMFVLNEATGGISFETAGILFFGGAGCFLIGLPLLIINSSRVKKIRKTFSDRISIELAPCSFNNYMAQTNQHGVTLRLRF